MQKCLGVMFLSRQNNNSSLKLSLNCLLFSQQSTSPAKEKFLFSFQLEDTVLTFMNTNVCEMENIQKMTSFSGNWYQMSQKVESPFYNVLRDIVSTSSFLRH